MKEPSAGNKAKDGRPKVQKCIANISCGQSSHEQYIKNIYSDPSGGKLQFACSECIFEGVVNEKQFPIKNDIESFLALMYSRHSSVLLKPQLVPNETPETVKELAQTCLRIKEISKILKEQTMKVVIEEIKKVKIELSKKLIEIMSMIETSLINHTEKLFKENTKPFELSLELLDHEENLKREICELKPEELKKFLEKYFEREKELSRSAEYKEELRKSIEEIEARTKMELPLEDQIPKFRGLALQIGRLTEAVFKDKEVFLKEMNSCVQRSFKLMLDISGSEQSNNTTMKINERSTMAILQVKTNL